MKSQDKILIQKAQIGDQKALEELLISNNRLIWKMVRKFWYTQIETDDLYQLACIGFIKSVKKFDFNYNVELSTYATEYILGEIKKYIRDDGIIKISRNIKEIRRKIELVEQKYGYNLSVIQLSNILDTSIEKINLALKSKEPINQINEDISSSLTISYENSTIEKIIILESIDKLKYRDKTVIKLRYFQYKTQSQIATILGISQVQVSRIEKNALSQLKLELVRGDNL